MTGDGSRENVLEFLGFWKNLQPKITRKTGNFQNFERDFKIFSPNRSVLH